MVDFLIAQPLLSLSLVIATGYALGAVDVKGFSLGVGAVLFTGLAVGAMAPAAQPPALLGALGLVLFLYALGVQFGSQFFAGLAGAAGRRNLALAMLALAAATAVTIVEAAALGVAMPLMVGLFAGSGTNAPAMQAAMEASGSSDPAVGYSVAYPFGLAGAILTMYVVQLIVRPALDAVSGAGLQLGEVTLQAPDVVGRQLDEVLARLPVGVRVLIVRRGGENRHPAPALTLAAGDVLLLGAESAAALAAARGLLGTPAPSRVVLDRSHVDYVRVFVSRGGLVGRRISELVLPQGVQATFANVRRGDAEMLISPDLTLEWGDRVGVLTERAAFPAVRAFFGDSMRGTSEFSYVALGLGLVLGVLLGLLPIPVPGLGPIKLGTAGGSLLVALILGRIGRIGAITWRMPLSANLTLRNFGLSVFLAQVGMASGAPFVATVAAGGLSLLAAGAGILLALTLTTLLVGHYVLRIPFDELLGVTAAVTGNPAILAYAFRAVPSDRVEICYAMTYPAATIAKIVIAQQLVGM
jgi:putative transport protein